VTDHSTLPARISVPKAVAILGLSRARRTGLPCFPALIPTGCGLCHGDRFVDIVRRLSALIGMDAAVRPADTPRRGSGFHHHA
jgi:hypothetical protein